MIKFTLKEIETAHEKVKSGADFPNYILELKELGVLFFETWVKDSHTEYFGKENYMIASDKKYNDLNISKVLNKELFQTYLKSHQQGQTDYITFCNHCAETGIEKWIVSLVDNNCIYYDINQTIVLKEEIPI